MSTEPGSVKETKYCRDCGEEINIKAEICPECGVRQEEISGTNSGGLTDQYTTVQWIAGIIVGLITIPLGLVIPAYLYIKASGGKGKSQGGWEVWTVILAGILGIIAVELGGEKGAKILWGIVVGGILLIIVAAMVGSFVLGLGDAASAQAAVLYLS